MAPSRFSFSKQVPSSGEEAQADKARQNTVEKRVDRLDKFFIRTVCFLIFVFYFFVTVGFGLMELYSSFQPQYTVGRSAAILSLLGFSFIPGLPLIFLSVIQSIRIAKGKISETAGIYRFYFCWAAITTFLLLLLWVLSLLI